MIEERNSRYKKIRESFHSIPELAFQEIETTKLIIKYLEEIKGFNEHVDITLTGKSGLIVTIPRNTKKPLIAFRADIDGLPICEKSQSQIKSKYPNQMHACGHDSHITIIIAIIEIMLENISKIERSVYGLRFIFQPAEEIGEILMISFFISSFPIFSSNKFSLIITKLLSLLTSSIFLLSF